MGASAGLTLRNVGGFGIPGGRRRNAAAIDDCTSCAAASSARSSTNWRVMLVDPRALVEVIESRPGMVENCRSRGVATEAAIVSGLAPGSPAFTWIVGKSTLGRSLTGSDRYPATPNATKPDITSVVITGRRIKVSVIFIGVEP